MFVDILKKQPQIVQGLGIPEDQICRLTQGPDDIRKAARYNTHGLDICGAYGQAGIDLFKVLVQQLGITLVLYSESLISNPKYTPNVLLFCDDGVQEQPMTTQQISRMVADEHHKRHPVIHILHHRADGKKGQNENHFSPLVYSSGEHLGAHETCVQYWWSALLGQKYTGFDQHASYVSQLISTILSPGCYLTHHSSPSETAAGPSDDKHRNKRQKV